MKPTVIWPVSYDADGFLVNYLRLEVLQGTLYARGPVEGVGEVVLCTSHEPNDVKALSKALGKLSDEMEKWYG